MIFVDSNIVIDLIEEGTWTRWSKQQLGARPGERLVTNLIVLAEISRAFGTVDEALIFLRELAMTLEQLTPEVAFRAGVAHVDYRLAGGRQASILADFLIAGHASALGATLMTRDKRRIGAYFPELTLIIPDFPGETDHG